MDELRAALVGLRDRAPGSLKSTIHARFELDPPKHDTNAIARAKARPAERLWERMEKAGQRELDDNPHAEQAEFYEAMIREVAAWLRDERQSPMTVAVLEHEANRG
jgi:hypothetical protein